MPRGSRGAPQKVRSLLGRPPLPPRCITSVGDCEHMLPGVFGHILIAALPSSVRSVGAVACHFSSVSVDQRSTDPPTTIFIRLVSRE